MRLAAGEFVRRFPFSVVHQGGTVVFVGRQAVKPDEPRFAHPEFALFFFVPVRYDRNDGRFDRERRNRFWGRLVKLGFFRLFIAALLTFGHDDSPMDSLFGTDMREV